MVDPAPVVAVPLRLRLVPVHLDGQAVHVEGQPPGPLAAALGARRPGAEFERRVAQHRPVGRLGHDGGEPRQRWLRGEAMRAVERRAPGRRTGRQPERGIVPERVRVVVIAPAPGGKQNARPDERGEVVDDILLAPRVLELRTHPLDDAAPLQDLAQDDGPGVTGQPLGAALDAQRPVEARGDRL